MASELYDGWQQDRDDEAYEQWRYSEEADVKYAAAATLSYIPSFQPVTVARVLGEKSA